MGRRQSQTATERDGQRELVLAFAERELRREGVAFEDLSYTPASGTSYDGLVVVWNDRRGRTFGVRLPEAA